MTRRVVLTRPDARQRQLAQSLQGQGFEVLQLPALGIKRLAREEFVWSEHGMPSEHASVSSESQMASSVPRVSTWSPGGFSVVVFVSRAAWQSYYQALAEASNATGSAFAWPDSVKIACVGISTAREIAADLGYSLSDILYPDDAVSSDSEGLWLKLKPLVTAGDRALVVRGRSGRDWLADTMVAAGLQVSCLSVYQRVAAIWRAEAVDTLRAWATEGDTGAWLITSRESLEALANQLHLHSFMRLRSSRPSAVVVIHDRLVPLVQQWLAENWPHEVGRGGGKVPVVVARPDDRRIAQALNDLVA